MWPSQTAAAGRTTGPATREYRALVTFAVAAVFVTLVVVVVDGNMERSATPMSVLWAGLLGIANNVVAAWGLAAGRPWARYAMTPILWIYVGAGVLTVLVALSRGSVNIPIGAILAAWALYAKPSEALGPIPPSSAAGAVLVAVTFVLSLGQFVPL